MSSDTPVIFRSLSLEIYKVTTADQLYGFAANAMDWFDNRVPINVYVDSDAGTLVVEQKHV